MRSKKAILEVLLSIRLTKLELAKAKPAEAIEILSRLNNLYRCLEIDQLIALAVDQEAA